MGRRVVRWRGGRGPNVSVGRCGVRSRPKRDGSDGQRSVDGVTQTALLEAAESGLRNGDLQCSGLAVSS